MKTLLEYLLSNEAIDEQWLNDKKPVKTAEGFNALIENIDRTKVPNVIKGKVNILDKTFDWEWNDDGTCIKATDRYGNPKQPEEKDKLIKAK